MEKNMGNMCYIRKRGEHHESCISMVPIFNHLEQDEVVKVSYLTHPISLKKGEILFNAGEKEDSIYIVHKGKIKIYRLTESGKEQVIRILTAGEFTGELAVFTSSVHEDYAEAAEQTEVCSIQNDHLHELLLHHPQITMKIISELSKRLDAAERQMTSIVTEDVGTRIALYLVQLAEESGTLYIELPATRKDIASFLGTTPETISRKLKQFEEHGWIKHSSQRAIKVLNLNALKNL